jgi:hypothetical protein
MSRISSVNSPSTLLYEMEQAAALKQAETGTANSVSEEAQAAASNPNQESESDGAAGINTQA